MSAGELLRKLAEMFEGKVLWTVLPLVPFVIAEQLRPAGVRPAWRDYLSNVIISLSTAVLMIPFGLAAGRVAQLLRARLPWAPLGFSFDAVGRVPVVGPALELLVMVAVPLFLHDLWFYWAHRISHKVPLLWELHKLHHSDQRMNWSTFARDQFTQAIWTAFFPVLTLGLVVDLDLRQAGRAALYANMFFIPWTMFCHSAVRVCLPRLDRVLVTPQVHRLHHSADPAHQDTNFADVLPLFDMLFGTYRAPRPGEFPATGLAGGAKPPTPWAAQWAPFAALIRRRRRGCSS
jgi:sterol desaturase/sphingolipid hydroxylase (fatty acid hydroxylase superfamily)